MNNDDFVFDEELIKRLIPSELTEEEREIRKQERAKELESKGFLPENEEFSETMSSPQEEVENNPKRFIIEECIPACQELWKKNIYTFMVSDHLNEGVCWIEVLFDSLSDENKEIFFQLSGEDVIRFTYHKGAINFGVKCVGKEGQIRLLELAKMFKMQDVPENQAYISPQKFLMNYCGCYDEIPNPNYQEMKPVWEMDLPHDGMIEYMKQYDEWKDSQESEEFIYIFNPNKASLPLSELVKEHQMILDDDRIYLSEFHYKKHQNYLEYLKLSVKSLK